MPIETQISVFLKNKVGCLNELCLALTQADINIRSLSTEIEVEWGIVGVLVEPDQVEKTKSVLKQKELNFGESKVLTVKLVNQPGSLASVTKRLTDNNISILHACVTSEGKNSLLVLMTTDNKRAAELIG